MDKNTENIKRAIETQLNGNASTLNIEFTFNDQEYRLNGRRTSVVQIGPKVVTLLTNESTPQNMSVAVDAEQEFNSAARELIETGRRFYTALRPGWNTPDFVWTKV